jgi:hypothetical protein
MLRRDLRQAAASRSSDDIPELFSSFNSTCQGGALTRNDHDISQNLIFGTQLRAQPTIRHAAARNVFG